MPLSPYSLYAFDRVLRIGLNDANLEPTVGHRRNAEGSKLVSDIRVEGELITVLHLRYSRSSRIMS